MVSLSNHASAVERALERSKTVYENSLREFRKLRFRYLSVIMLAPPQQAAGRVQSFSQEESCLNALEKWTKVFGMLQY